jgi:hypothetical protein
MSFKVGCDSRGSACHCNGLRIMLGYAGRAATVTSERSVQRFVLS